MLERLRLQDDKLNARMFRPKGSETRDEIEQHNQHVQTAMLEEKKRKKEEEERKQKQQEWEASNPQFEIDGRNLMAIIAELNKVRLSPKLYIKHLKELLEEGAYSGTTFKIPDTEVTRETKEGEEALRDAINFLTTSSRLEMLKHSDGLSTSCYDLIRNHNPRGLTGPILSDGTTAETRVNLYGTCHPPFEELFDYGFQTPEDVVLKWILADGDPARKSRKIVLSEELSTIGICVGPHSKFKIMTVVTFCKDYEENK